MVYFLCAFSMNVLTKLFGYQQPTCLCVMKDFVVGTTTSLSCELYSLSWSCFLSGGVGTIVYGKWCIVLQYMCSALEVAWSTQNKNRHHVSHLV